MNEKPVFIQGLFPFKGGGLSTPVPLKGTGYQVPPDRRAQTIYVRAGNPSEELVYLVLTLNGKPMRYFPVGAKGAVHVPLAVVEDLEPESRLDLLIAAPEGITSSVLIDAASWRLPDDGEAQAGRHRKRNGRC